MMRITVALLVVGLVSALSACDNGTDRLRAEIDELRQQAAVQSSKCGEQVDAIDESKIHAEMVGAGCERGAAFYARMMKRENIPGDRWDTLCRELSYDANEGGITSCRPLQYACLSTYCQDLGPFAPQSACMGLSIGGYANSGKLQPPVYIAGGEWTGGF